MSAEFDAALPVFRARRNTASLVHISGCAWASGSPCDCGEPDRQRHMLDAMRNTAAALNSGEPAEVALKKLLEGLR